MQPNGLQLPGLLLSTGSGASIPTVYTPGITTPGLPAQPTRFTA